MSNKKNKGYTEKDTQSDLEAEIIAKYEESRKKKIFLLKVIGIPLAIILLIAGLYYIKQSGESDKKKEDLLTELKAQTKTQQNEHVNSLDSVYVSQFDIDKLKKYNVPILISFSASWCEPCERLDPILEQVKAQLKDKVVIKIVDVDKNPTFISQYPLTVLPTQIVYTAHGKAYNPENFIGINNFKSYAESSKDKEPSLTLHQGEMTKSEVLTLINDMQTEENKVKEPVTQAQLEADERNYSTQLHSKKYLKEHKEDDHVHDHDHDHEHSATEVDETKFKTIEGHEE